MCSLAKTLTDAGCGQALGTKGDGREAPAELTAQRRGRGLTRYVKFNVRGGQVVRRAKEGKKGRPCWSKGHSGWAPVAPGEGGLRPSPAGWGMQLSRESTHGQGDRRCRRPACSGLQGGPWGRAVTGRWF